MLPGFILQEYWHMFCSAETTACVSQVFRLDLKLNISEVFSSKVQMKTHLVNPFPCKI